MRAATVYDAIIIGGSYAGLSAALTLGRSLRTVLVIDAGKPCNRQTPHAHGYLTRDGTAPAELMAIAREQLQQYPSVELWPDTVVTAVQEMDTFVITTGEGMSFRSRKLVLATGVVDIMPDLPGFAECWGRSVLHCPYCHGYEVHGQPLGLLGNGEAGYEMATHIQQWSNQLTLFTNGPSTLTTTQRQVIDQLGIAVIETPIVAIEHEQGFLSALRLEDGDSVALKAVFARVPFRHHTDLAAQLGCTLTEAGLIEVTEFGQTTVPGVFAAGDVTTPFRQLAMAVTKGAFAGVFINKELIAETLQKKGMVEVANA